MRGRPLAGTIDTAPEESPFGPAVEASAFDVRVRFAAAHISTPGWVATVWQCGVVTRRELLPGGMTFHDAGRMAIDTLAMAAHR